jgi:cytidylate kinase
MPPVNVITVTQQYGSEGHKVAAKLAARLGWRLRSDEIAGRVARSLDMSGEEALFYAEHCYSFVERALLSMQFSFVEILTAWPDQYAVPVWPLRKERLYHEQLRHVVGALAQRREAVIVGHAAQAILANRPDVLHVRVVAPFGRRVHHAMQAQQLDEAAASTYVRRKDRGQAYYLRRHYHRDINDPLLYDLAITNDSLDLESQVDLICLALERSARGR